MLASETNKCWRRGYVSGSFDMFHIGHLNLIRRAKERCSYLIAGVLADEIIVEKKSKWPVIPLSERMDIVGALKYVDEVDITTKPLMDKINAWHKYHFDAMFSGDDHAGTNDGWEAEGPALKNLGADLVFFPYTKGVSTTQLQEISLPPISTTADMARNIKPFRHLFPFDKVSKGERIVIYGIGQVGEQYSRQIAALDYCEIFAFADTYANQGDIYNNKPCLTPEEVIQHMDDFDRIIVASTAYYSQILSRLRALSVPPERIV